MKHPRDILMALLLGLLAALPAPAAGSSEPSAEDLIKIKAAFVYNFVKYAQWPDDAYEGDDSPIVIGVAGSDAAREAMSATVRGKTVHNRPLRVIAIEAPRTNPKRGKAYAAELEQIASTIAGCHVVFFEADAHAWVTAMYRQGAAFDTTLAVGDGEAYLETDTTLDLVKSDRRMVFYANHPEIDRSRLKISSKLLRLALEASR